MLAVTSGCKLAVERGPDWLLVRVESLDGGASDTPLLADEVWSLLQRHFTYRLVLELDRVEMLNSHLIGQLVQLYKLIREHDGVMRLCGLSAYNLQVLKRCRLDDRFLPYCDREEAVMGCCCPRQAK